MRLSEEEKQQELGNLEEFLNSVKIAAQLVPKGGMLDDVSLLVCLPSVEEIPEDLEDATAENMHFMSACLMELDDSQEKISKYLGCYTQIRADMSGIPELEVLKLVNRMNRTVRVGHYFYDEPEGAGEKLVQYRASVMGAAEQPLDEGVVAEAILEMGIGYDMMKDALEDLAKEYRKS